ncbi:MAG: FAD-dependent oxidoreductase [Bacillota bacterium]
MKIFRKSIILICFLLLLVAFYSTETGQTHSETPKLDGDKEQIPPRVESYEVIVVGGEPEGVAAAVAAARNGSKTLLIEQRDALGGLFTFGMMNFIDFPLGANGKLTSQGVFKEWHKSLSGYSTFDIAEAKSAFAQLVKAEKNLTLYLNTDVVDITKNETGNSLSEMLVNKEGEQIKIIGKRFIDATQDADFSVLAGAPYFIGSEDIGLPDKKMAVTLMLHYKGVDWNGVRETVKSKKFGYSNANNEIAWGFGQLINMYKPVEENTRLRGLNMSRIGNDEVYINALQIFGVDGLDQKSKQEAIEKGKRETAHILEYLRKNFQGFERAEISSYPPELYVRETRHVLTEYQLPVSDIWENRDHWDSIAIGGYPVDVQAQTIYDLGYVTCDPIQYAIPFRSLVPLEIDNLLVTGRSAGYSSLAAGSVRIVATGMATGQAAGVAAAISLGEGITFRAMTKDEPIIKKLRSVLSSQGAYIEHFNLSYPYQGEWYYESLRGLMNYGLIVGGYKNNIGADTAATKHMFVFGIQNIIQRSNPELYQTLAQEMMDLNKYTYLEKNEPLTRDLAAEIILESFGKDIEQDAWSSIKGAGLTDDLLAGKLNNNRTLKVKEAYYWLNIILQYAQTVK